MKRLLVVWGVICGMALGAGLAPRAFEPLPAGSVTPRGWLLKQLQLQASGLSATLDLFWGDVANSIWTGGNMDTGLHERFPYWCRNILSPLLSFLYVHKKGGVGACAPLCLQD